MKGPCINPNNIKPDNSGMHVLIPFAVARDPAAQQVLSGLQLPHLVQLLARLSPMSLDTADEDSLTLPHERALARALGLPIGPQIPLAAWQARTSTHAQSNTQAWAFVTPCYWNLGQAQITLDPPQVLALTEAESRALLAAMQPYFEEDGITLVYESPARWLAHGEVFRTLATASPERVVGQGDIKPWMPAAPTLRRLQNEMQMLLYTHPVNEARTERGAYPVNSFWVSGSGALTAPITTSFSAEIHPFGLSLSKPGEPFDPSASSGQAKLRANGKSLTPTLVAPLELMHAALQHDWLTWGQAWTQLDATVCADLLRALDQNGPPERATLTLCGERSAQTYTAAKRSLGQKIISLFGPKPIEIMRNQL